MRACRRLRDKAGPFSRRRSRSRLHRQGAQLDITYYRQREQAEHAFAQQAYSEEARASHLNLADRYRELIEAYERLAPAEEPDSSAVA
jgi:hypothetical protein